ncbi:MAG: AAA family ATPase [Planctomycetes bacterium]|nr:AAA family ATPase [Planctomycetota bacterium]MCH7602389.1 AAA family ATPase [Planctomycetota bacterium]
MPQSGKESNHERLEKLILSGHSCITIETHEELYTLGLIESIVKDRLDPLWHWTAVRGVFAGMLPDSRPIPETEHPAAAMYHLAAKEDEPCVTVMIDLAGHLADARTLRSLRELIQRFDSLSSTLILIDHDGSLPGVIKSTSTSFELSLPDEDELRKLAKQVVRNLHELDTEHYKIKISKSDFDTLVRNLRGLTRSQAEQVMYETLANDAQLDAADINTVLALKRRRLHIDGVLEYVEAPVSMDEIGGLKTLKTWLKQRRKALTDKAVEFGLTPPRGILLLGVQGAGKSLASKAVATSWQRPLLRLDPGSLYDRYVGESERRLREALQQAEMMSPIVLWIDEIEKGFASAAGQSTDGGLSQRMFGTLLSWMQEHREPVFIVATANNIDALPPELLRKGRFDEIFFVDLPSDTVRMQIFAIHLRKRNRDTGKFDLAALGAASEGYSGAEIEQAVISAMHEAFSEKDDLDTNYILKAIKASPPLAVVMEEKVTRLRQWAQSRCLLAD